MSRTNNFRSKKTSQSSNQRNKSSNNPKSISKSPQSRSNSKPTKKKVEKTTKSKQKPTTNGYTEFNPQIIEKHCHFKKYIEEDSTNKTRFICVACKNKGQKNHSGQYDFLDRHLATQGHSSTIPQEDQNEISEAIKIFKGFRSGMRKEEPTDLDAIKKLRIEYTGFLLKHELPFSLAPKIVQFNQNIIKKYGVATISQTNLSHTTAGQIARSCISKTFKNAIYNDLKHSVFSLSFDESAEHNGPSYLCAHARYVKDGKIEHKLLALNEIKDSSTGASLYDIIMKKIFSHSFSAELEKNLVGVVTDRGRV